MPALRVQIPQVDKFEIPIVNPALEELKVEPKQSPKQPVMKIIPFGEHLADVTPSPTGVAIYWRRPMFVLTLS